MKVWAGSREYTNDGGVPWVLKWLTCLGCLVGSKCDGPVPRTWKERAPLTGQVIVG